MHWLMKGNFDKIFTMLKILLLPLLSILLLLDPLLGQVESPACALGHGQTEIVEQGEEHLQADPCVEGGAIMQPEQLTAVVHTAGCGCALLPYWVGNTAVPSPTHPPLSTLFRPQTAVIPPLTPPPRVL